jgi:hypothetical protein
MQKNEALAQVLASMQEHKAALEAALEPGQNNGWILAYPNGLGIRFVAPNQPQACGLLHAEEIISEEQAAKMPEEAWAWTPIVKNGHGEQAQIIRRQAAIKRELASLELHIAELQERAA